MFRFKVFLTLLFLVCPWGFSYGQIHFASVNGERGYAAMKGNFKLDLDNGFIFSPAVGYYRMSDDTEDESGALTKFLLKSGYELTDDLLLSVYSVYIPRRMGFREVGYGVGVNYQICYRCGWFKNLYADGRIGQARYKIRNDTQGISLINPFKTNATAAALEVGTELGRFSIQTRYDKVIKYSSKPQDGVTSQWTEIPFMVAVVQGFVRDITSTRVSYQTRWITPYGVYARYKYLEHSDYTVSIAGGLSLQLGATTLSGGVEIFEQNREENRKTYFSMSASTAF